MQNIISSIVKALTEILENEFPKIEIYSTNIRAGYETPCFFVVCDNVKTGKYNTKIDTLSMDIDIIYSCEDRDVNQQEIFVMANTLRNLFIDKPILVNESISIAFFDDVLNLEDDSLTLSLELELQLLKDLEEDLEEIENINLKL